MTLRQGYLVAAWARYWLLNMATVPDSQSPFDHICIASFINELQMLQWVGLNQAAAQGLNLLVIEVWEMIVLIP